jgi:hypothetical protein
MRVPRAKQVGGMRSVRARLTDRRVREHPNNADDQQWIGRAERFWGLARTSEIWAPVWLLVSLRWGR